MALQSIRIVGRQERRDADLSSLDPSRAAARGTKKTVTFYAIQCQGSARPHQVWKRYNDFVQLHRDLVAEVEGHRQPPEPLPPKSKWRGLLNLPSLPGTGSRSEKDPGEESFLQERQDALERYLRAILSSPDERWRESRAWNSFLHLSHANGNGCLTAQKSSEKAHLTGPSLIPTSSAWLAEHTSLQALTRVARSALSDKQMLAKGGSDSAAAHAASAQFSQILISLSARTKVLRDSIDGPAVSEGLTQGELERRIDLCERLWNEREGLVRESNQQQMQSLAAPIRPASTDADDPARRALFSGGSTAPMGLSSGSRGSGTPTTRVLGGTDLHQNGQAPPRAQETNITRPLPSQGLLQLQSNMMEQQDQQLDALSAIIARQRELGLAIHSEVSAQNEMLDGLTGDTDKFDAKLTKARRQIKRL